MPRCSTALAMAAVVALLLAPSPGCGKGPGGGAEKIERDREAPAVVVVDSPTAQTVTVSDEVEPNNEAEQAMALAVGTGVRGTLDGDSDIDLYSLEVADGGVLAAELSGIAGVDLVLELRDAEGAVLARSDRGPAEVAEGLPNFAVAPGRYQLAISEFIKKSRRRARRAAGKDAGAGRVGPSPIYQLTVRVAPPPEDRRAAEFEREPNDSEDDGAAELLIGDHRKGYLGWRGDRDRWKLSIEGFAADYGMNIDIDGVDGVTPTLVIRTRDGATVLRRSGRKGEGLAVRNLVVVRGDSAAETDDGESPGDGDNGDGDDGDDRAEGQAEADDGGLTEYYVAELSARRSNPITPYRIHMTARLLDSDEEREPNDAAATAIELDRPTGADSARPIDGTWRGYLTAGDIDHYRIRSAEGALLALVAKPEGGPGSRAADSIDIELSVLAGDAVVATSNAGKVGASEALDAVAIAPGASVLIKVAGRGGSGDQAAYQLRWSVEPLGAEPPAPGDSTDTGSPAGDPGLLDEYGDE
ncbi:MAG: hypothetical protein AAGC55_05065 [Myxococcota bacterium]